MPLSQIESHDGNPALVHHKHFDSGYARLRLGMLNRLLQRGESHSFRFALSPEVKGRTFDVNEIFGAAHLGNYGTFAPEERSARNETPQRLLLSSSCLRPNVYGG